MKNVPGAIIIPSELKQQPRKHEIKAALALAKYFKADVEFVATSHHTSPDFLIRGTLWELKSPQGKGRNNIEHQLKSALRQSPNIILDSSRSKMHSKKIERDTLYQFRLIRHIRRVVFITKSHNVYEIYR